MTLEEAKKILKKEGYDVEKVGRPSSPSIVFTAYESPEICEAMQVVCSAGYGISMVSSRFDDRKARLSLELAENSAPMPGPGEEQPKKGNPALEEAASQFNDALLDEQAKKIGEQNKEITRLLSLVEKKENSISRLYYEKSVLEKENEDLKKGEIPARYFDKALVDEQAEKIKKLEHEKLDILEIASSCKQTIAEQGKKIKRLSKEIARLNKIIHKKNMKIEELRKESSRFLRGKIKMFGETVDLSQELCDKNEELRLTKIREKNLTEVCQKYVKENEKLKKKLAEKIVNKIDAQALKSAESALAYKEKVIAEKDEVIADLGNELAEAKKLNTAKIFDINAKCMRAARESINDVFESYAAKYAKSTLDELKDKAYESFNAKSHKLGFVGSKDGKGIIDQIEEEKKLSLFRDDSVGAVTNQKDCSSAKDTHPTEDNPEEVELGEILECVRKALEKGHTVSIDYDIAEEGGDQSATIVQCDNGIILSKEEAEIIERCTKNGTELHYSEKDGLTYTIVFGEEMPIRCLRGMFHVFTDEEIQNMKK
nr:MAG: hypothetical protein [Bacteriophage sp.]UWG23198.1 MAG: hypothetical protein [Bacteriophage sp.]